MVLVVVEIDVDVDVAIAVCVDRDYCDDADVDDEMNGAVVVDLIDLKEVQAY